VTTDLWAALSEASGKPVQSWMESWTRQTGFPLITVSEEGGLKLRQNRFLSSGPPAAENDQQLWWVPINASQGGGDGKAEELPLFVLKVRGGRAAAKLKDWQSEVEVGAVMKEKPKWGLTRLRPLFFVIGRGCCFCHIHYVSLGCFGLPRLWMVCAKLLRREDRWLFNALCGRI
jgi:hypothetical protein